MRNKTLIVCSAPVVSLRPQWRKLETMCEMFQMDARTLCWCGGRFCLWDLSGINFFLFLVCVLCISIFFLCFVTFLCVFFVNYSSPQIRNTCAPNLGEIKLLRKRILHPFSFHNVWCLCSNCLFIKRIKLCLCFVKFYNIFLNLRAI